MKKFLAILLLTLSFTVAFANAPSDDAAQAIENLTGVGNGTQTNGAGCLILSHTAAVAEYMLESLNQQMDNDVKDAGGRILIATGKVAEDLKKLFKQVKDSSLNVKNNVLIVYGDAAEKIAEEFAKTGLVAQKLLADQYKNVILLGTNTIQHATKVIGNLAMTGIYNVATAAVVAADYALAAGALCYEAAGVIIVATVSGALLVVDYSVVGLTALVKVSEKGTIYLTNVSAKAVVGIVKIGNEGTRYVLEQTDAAMNEVFTKIIEKEAAAGNAAVANTEKMKNDSMSRLKKAIANFGKKKDSILNHKITICRIPVV